MTSTMHFLKDHQSYINQLLFITLTILHLTSVRFDTFSLPLYVTCSSQTVRRIYLSLNADVSTSGQDASSDYSGYTSATAAGQADRAGQAMRIRSGSSERLVSLSPTSSNERLAGTGDQRSSNSKLSESGREYGVDLGRYLKVNYQMSGRSRPKSSPLNEDLGSELMVLTGTSSVHTETVSHLRMLFKCYNTPLLNELRGGDLQGMVRVIMRSQYTTLMQYTSLLLFYVYLSCSLDD